MTIMITNTIIQNVQNTYTLLDVIGVDKHIRVGEIYIYVS